MTGRSIFLLSFTLLGAPALGADDAATLAGEWSTTRGPLLLEANGADLAGRLVFWKLPVRGQAKDGKLVLQYDEGRLHFNATLDLDPTGRSFSGLAVANNGGRGVWSGWRADPVAAQGEPADFSGFWLTTMGLMKLSRDGARYRGQYAFRGTSAIEGQAKGRHLEAHIKANLAGPAWFDLDEAGTTLFGAGGTDDRAPWYAWSGQKAPHFPNHVALKAGEIVDGSTDGLLTYSVRAPERYQADDTRKWPVILILHGSNMNGRAYVNTIAGAWPDLARDYILLGINGELPSRTDPADPAFNYTYINYVGKGKGFPGTDRESPALVREAMDELRQVYPIKHYLVGGHSQGGYLAYSMMMTQPEAVAGAFPVSAEVIVQAEPTFYGDETVKAAQRAIPLAIVHGVNDPQVPFSSATYASGIFLNAGWPAARLFADDKAGHMFGLLPIGPAVRWLEALTSRDPTTLLDFAERRLGEKAPRDTLAALRQVRKLDLAPALRDRAAQISKTVDAAAAPQAHAFLAAMNAGQDRKWVDDFLAFRDEYEYADSAAAAMKSFDDLRAAQDEPAAKLINEARGRFNQDKPAEGYAKVQEVVDKYPASTSYRLAKTWLANRR